MKKASMKKPAAKKAPMKVEPYKTKLCQGNAYWMAVLSELVYLDDPDEILQKLKRMPGGEKFQQIRMFDKASSQAMFVEHEDYLTMAFRGTDEFGDWIDNVMFFSKRTALGKFHRGFWKATCDVWRPLHAAYQEARSRKKRALFLTGHSLGGAMATVAAAKLLIKDKPFISVYTFGQPRAMKAKTAPVFNNYIGGRFYRFHNNKDLVTRVPTRARRFSHAGKCVYITGEGKIYDDPSFWYHFLDQIDNALEQVKGWRRGKAKISHAVRDHGMSNYMNFIRECKDFPDG